MLVGNECRSPNEQEIREWIQNQDRLDRIVHAYIEERNRLDEDFHARVGCEVEFVGDSVHLTWEEYWSRGDCYEHEERQFPLNHLWRDDWEAMLAEEKEKKRQKEEAERLRAEEELKKELAEKAQRAEAEERATLEKLLAKYGKPSNT